MSTTGTGNEPRQPRPVPTTRPGSAVRRPRSAPMSGPCRVQVQGTSLVILTDYPLPAPDSVKLVAIGDNGSVEIAEQVSPGRFLMYGDCRFASGVNHYSFKANYRIEDGVVKLDCRGGESIFSIVGTQYLRLSVAVIGSHNGGAQTRGPCLSVPSSVLERFVQAGAASFSVNIDRRQKQAVVAFCGRGAHARELPKVKSTRLTKSETTARFVLGTNQAFAYPVGFQSGQVNCKVEILPWGMRVSHDKALEGPLETWAHGTPKEQAAIAFSAPDPVAQVIELPAASALSYTRSIYNAARAMSFEDFSNLFAAAFEAGRKSK